MPLISLMLGGSILFALGVLVGLRFGLAVAATRPSTFEDILYRYRPRPDGHTRDLRFSGRHR
ncbi:hypothetical protein CWB41_13845 [Methylovirgula ligni]|uniref:Uncharacterized protein n=1 Tax=Methylovirgula ligni TaxID=569860 RepID=A0A3D9YP62_9HYPH|nr:hypothetical protein [Methylovirgula ligni]QAY96676.1 hypothetical protein CWB41_13845 [Methylovirgula ligni]REF83283.1 hypothetical protein DES32_3199 [Methylovirgula ligni]